jgi:hypothetical protein
LRERHRTQIVHCMARAASSGLQVLETMYTRPILSVADVVAITKTSFTAANALVSRLEALGVLREITGFARNRRYRYEEYVRIFSEASDVVAEGA